MWKLTGLSSHNGYAFIQCIGKQVCENFKANQQIAPAPLIMIPVLQDAPITDIAQNADYFLSEPFKMKDVFQTINAALSSQKNYVTVV
ncbi:hypothetical protein [Ferruginibacter sp.]|uniref:hypothetical protein n=1 Tax=Ferruginibacter sp. TaxID=1940288 RepID=UPI0026590E94|nr:hypothetical protein [Ferruginibacter sp.]